MYHLDNRSRLPDIKECPAVMEMDPVALVVLEIIFAGSEGIFYLP